MVPHVHSHRHRHRFQPHFPLSAVRSKSTPIFVFFLSCLTPCTPSHLFSLLFPLSPLHILVPSDSLDTAVIFSTTPVWGITHSVLVCLLFSISPLSSSVVHIVFQTPQAGNYPGQGVMPPGVDSARANADGEHLLHASPYSFRITSDTTKSSL